MLALVKKPHTEIFVNGEGAQDVLDFLKTKYNMEIFTPNVVQPVDPDEELVNVDETEYGKANRYRVLAGARLRRGLTQTQLADKLGIRQSVLSEYEHGKRKVTQKFAEKLAAALNTYPEKFITKD